MDLYVFRLDERSGAFAGVLLIFLSDPPAVWRKLAGNEAPEHIPHMVASREEAEIEAELKALEPGAQVDGGRGPLWQVLGDAHLTLGHRVTFMERDDVSLVVPTPPESSLRAWAEHWYRKIAG